MRIHRRVCCIPALSSQTHIVCSDWSASFISTVVLLPGRYHHPGPKITLLFTQAVSGDTHTRVQFFLVEPKISTGVSSRDTCSILRSFHPIIGGLNETIWFINLYQVWKSNVSPDNCQPLFETVQRSFSFFQPCVCKCGRIPAL